MVQKRYKRLIPARRPPVQVHSGSSGTTFPCGKTPSRGLNESSTAPPRPPSTGQSSTVRAPPLGSPGTGRLVAWLSCRTSGAEHLPAGHIIHARARLPLLHSEHTAAHKRSGFARGPRDCGGSPSATMHDISCVVCGRDSENSRFALPPSVRRPSTSTKRATPRWSRSSSCSATTVGTFDLLFSAAMMGTSLAWYASRPPLDRPQSRPSHEPLA